MSLVHSPFRAISMHNKKESEATDLHDAAPYCYPKRIVGPFYTEERAKQFSHELIHGTRGLESLCKQLDRMLQVGPSWIVAFLLNLGIFPRLTSMRTFKEVLSGINVVTGSAL